MPQFDQITDNVNHTSVHVMKETNKTNRTEPNTIYQSHQTLETNKTCSITLPQTNISVNNIYNIPQADFINNYLHYSPNTINSSVNYNCIQRYNISLNAIYNAWWNQLFVFPKAKLIVHASAKTGSSTMRVLTAKLREKYLYKLGSKFELESPNDILKYLCSNDYKRIFLVRDPLARLLSGYLDKCTTSTHKFRNRWNWHVPCKKIFEFICN
eukprot:83699_1